MKKCINRQQSTTNIIKFYGRIT